VPYVPLGNPSFPKICLWDKRWAFSHLINNPRPNHTRVKLAETAIRAVPGARVNELSELFHQAIFLKFAAALVALLNPIYGIPIFLGMTEGYSAAERRRTASVIALTVLIAAIVATLIGEEILRFFGISVPAFQIAGGIIVLGIGLSMLKDDGPTEGDSKAAAAGHERRKNIAVVPLSIPLTIGPGTFATIILFTHLLDDGSEIVTMLPVVMAVCLTVWLGLLFAHPISRFLGETMISVITRLMAIVLAAVAVEMIINGTVQAIQMHYPNVAKTAMSGL